MSQTRLATLERQPALAGAVGEGLHAAVIAVAGAVARRCRAPSRGRGAGGAAAAVPWSRRSCALTDLALDVLALVADALALVRLGRARLAYAGGDLADLLLGDAADDHRRRRRHLELDTGRRLDLH